MIDEIYSIDSEDEKWHAEISACCGANVIKLQYEGEDVFVPLNSEEQLKINPYVQGCPILFPANRTYKGEFMFEGVKYNLPINEPQNDAHLHGFLHLQQFELLEIKPNSIELCYENKGKIYPFLFSVRVVYSLTDNSFKQSYYIKNTGIANIPVTFALHTTFAEPESFSVPINYCQEKDARHIPTGRYVPLNTQEKRYVLGSVSKGISISGYYKSCGNTARIGNYLYTVSQNFDHWILYNGKGENGLLCVEPQCGAVNGFNIDGGFRVIEPDKELIFYTEISR